MAAAAKESAKAWVDMLSEKVVKNLNVETMMVSNEMSTKPSQGRHGGGGGLFGLFASQQPVIKRNSKCNYTLFSNIDSKDIATIIDKASSSDVNGDRAIGSVIGMGLGDAFGAPLEFRSITQCVMNDKESESNKQDCDDAKPELQIKLNKNKKNELIYIEESNKFGLKRGQWTDDASMGLCMADSLIVNKIYDGSDIRVRFYNWWHNGYNNAFRKDNERAKQYGGQGSVGLGGNISQSIFSMADFEFPDSIYKVDHNREDSGNGSVMRLSPVSVFFHQNVELARKYSSESSFTTHPGYIAAEACSFMSYIIVKAIHAPWQNSNENENEKSKSNETQYDLKTMVPSENVKVWLDLVTQEYRQILTNEINELKSQKEENGDKDVDTDMDGSKKDKKEQNDEKFEKSENDGNSKLIERQINAKQLVIQLIDCGGDGEKYPNELNWNWKLDCEKYKQVMIDTYHRRRGDKLKQDGTWQWGRDQYNGYPVSATYWGSYCMDGLAMGLYGVYNSKSFAHAIQLCVNLLGDADSTGSIGGQIAGSIYGYRSLLDDNTYGGQKMVELLNKWDEKGFEIRGLLLYQLGNEYKHDDNMIKEKHNQIFENFKNALPKSEKGKKKSWLGSSQE